MINQQKGTIYTKNIFPTYICYQDNAPTNVTKNTGFLDAADKDTTTEKADDNPEGVHNTIMDLHLELLYMYHRVCIKLANSVNGGSVKTKTASGKGQKSRATSEQRLVRIDGERLWSNAVTTLLQCNAVRSMHIVDL